jgi:hypothetical protein
VELVEQSVVKSQGAAERKEVLSSIRTALVSPYYTLFLAFRHYQASFAFFLSQCFRILDFIWLKINGLPPVKHIQFRFLEVVGRHLKISG